MNQGRPGLTWAPFITDNLIPVTMGNTINDVVLVRLEGLAEEQTAIMIQGLILWPHQGSVYL